MATKEEQFVARLALGTAVEQLGGVPR